MRRMVAVGTIVAGTLSVVTGCSDNQEPSGSNAQAPTFGDVIDTRTDEPGMAPCEHEDGSGPSQPLPCFWDATQMGNGKGLSFIVTRDNGDRLCYTYLDRKAQKRLGGCEE